ncbi:hypothetical protein BJ508DRAFT_131061 [Ascobolus immersus RN42]|uniref:Uncharacterized protein n=1 Tax=Ascobolus immersus RN42 TaxID=1160509 RepID=A0A3N4I434_ASCIM|nr:hypothetical protein BJ508DRAFT_131061 [Ascobolus immersus RN42]
MVDGVEVLGGFFEEDAVGGLEFGEGGGEGGAEVLLLRVLAGLWVSVVSSCMVKLERRMGRDVQRCRSSSSPRLLLGQCGWRFRGLVRVAYGIAGAASRSRKRCRWVQGRILTWRWRRQVGIFAEKESRSCGQTRGHLGSVRTKEVAIRER